MKPMLWLFDNAWVVPLGWTLVHFLWQGAAIAAALALVQTALRKRSAQARYRAGCIALFLMMAAPLATLGIILQRAEPHSAPPTAPFELTVVPTASAELVDSSFEHHQLAIGDSPLAMSIPR